MQSDRIDYLLQELRCAALRARLVQLDIDAIGLGLKCGLITPEQAIEDLHDCNALQYVIPTPPEEHEAASPPLVPTTKPRPTPQVPVEALVLAVREHGIKALHEPRNQERLKECDPPAREQLNKRLAKLVPEGAIL